MYETRTGDPSQTKAAKRTEVMKCKIRVWTIGCLLSVAAMGEIRADVTNVALVANISLTGFKAAGDSNAAPVRITNRDILNALNASGNFSFSQSAQLLFVSFEDQEPTVRVRDTAGGTTTTTDISDFFSITQPEEVDANHELTSYAYRIFSFDNHNGTSFTVAGLITMQRGPITSRTIGQLLRVRTGMAQVTGSGTIGGTDVVLRGTINSGAPMSEVDPQ